MISLVLIAALLLTIIDPPSVLSPQNGSSAVSSRDSRVRWKAEWDMEEVTVKGKRAVRFTETGFGRMSAYPEEVRWTVRSTWTATGTFRPLETERTVTAADGKVLLVGRKHFDQETLRMTLERQASWERPVSKSLSVPEDTPAIEGLPGILRFANVPQSRRLEVNGAMKNG